MGEVLPGIAGADYGVCLVGDLNADKFEDVIVLGEQGSHAFRFATNGQFREVTSAAGLKGLKAKGGVLADLDFTGRLDLLTILPGGQGLQVMRNLGNFYFLNNPTNAGLPKAFAGVENVMLDDFNNEDVPGLLVSRAGSPPLSSRNNEQAPLWKTNLTAAWPAAKAAAMGDFNNDLLLDAP
jgi:hypothetical protein